MEISSIISPIEDIQRLLPIFKYKELKVACEKLKGIFDYFINSLFTDILYIYRNISVCSPKSMVCLYPLSNYIIIFHIFSTVEYLKLVDLCLLTKRTDLTQAALDLLLVSSKSSFIRRIIVFFLYLGMDSVSIYFHTSRKDKLFFSYPLHF